MFGLRKKMKKAANPYEQYIERFQKTGALKEGKISIQKITTGYEKSRDDDTRCDVCKFRCGKGAEFYCLVIIHGQPKTINLLENIEFASPMGRDRFWYLDEYLKSYDIAGETITEE